MTTFQFILLSWILYACPYIPPALAGFAAGIFGKEQDVPIKCNFVRYWVAEVIVGVIVFGLTIYIAEIGAFAGVFDSNMLMKGGERVEEWWEASRYSLQIIGMLLGALFINKGTHSKNDRGFGRSLLLLAALCVVYGLAVPTLLNNFLVAVRDSHLLK